MRKLIFLCFLYAPYGLLGQFFDDFSQDLSTWSGDTALFQINQEEQLRLHASESGKAFIWREVTTLDSAIWQGDVRLDFQPSNANRLKFLLMADSQHVQNGLWMEIGESGNEDPLRLMKSVQGRDSVLHEFFLPSFQGNSVDFEFSLKSGINGSQMILFDHSDTLVFEWGGDYSHAEDFLVGIHCIFTKTRKDKFSFDNIGAGQIPVDTVVPLMDGVEIIDSQNILIAFTEALDPDAKLEIELKPKVGIESSTLVGDNQTLHITLKDALTNGNGYKLSLRGATDINGNRSPLLEVRFQYIRLAYASPYEILIHEIMADPSPPRALPECEFIELLNNSQKYFNLADYTIADDRSQAFLPDAILAPGEMVILCERTCFDQFMNFGRAIVVNDLPVINNGGDHLQLVDFAGRVIHAIEFDMTWYGDSERSGGGWSLEMRHPEDVCLGAPNWHAANYEDCGTPGKRNSVTIGEPSDRMMYIRKSIALDDHLVEVVFDRTLDLVQDDLKVWITPDRNIVQKEIMDNTLHLTTNERMQPGTPYKIRLEDVRSCLGVLERNDLHAEVYLPRPADSGDLVINEVLFDPRSGGVEFIEIRNVTSDYLSIDRLCIEVLDHKDTTFECIDEPIIIPDNGHLALSEDTTVLLSDYLCGELEVLNLPTLSDERAEIRCFQYDFGFRKPLDVMRYEASWHNPAYSSTEGVSLEKSEPADSGLKRSSWYSAASTSGYATPGLKNSIDIPFSSSERVLSLENEAFSPNGDGFKDYTVIHLHPDRPGYNLRLDIFDIEGRYVKRVANNAILGSDETFIWDGTDNDHRLQPIGLYLILAELAHPDGKMMREKATVVLN